MILVLQMQTEAVTVIVNYLFPSIIAGDQKTLFFTMMKQKNLKRL
jgi:hypothetical protein